MAKTFNFQLVGLEDQYESKARVYLDGVSNGGKTFGSLLIAKGLGGRTVVVDTEKRSSGKYLRYFHDLGFDYEILPLGEKHPKTGRRDYSPEAYIAAIDYAEKQGYDVCILDSLSHAWFGEGGELDMVNDKAAGSRSGNTYYAWRDVTPWHNKLIDSMLQSDMHIIATLRVKSEYETDIVNGKQVPKKIGKAPIMREGLEYEFDIGFRVDIDHNAVVTKTRCQELDGQVFRPIGEGVGQIINDWVSGKPDPKKQHLPEDDVAKVKDLAKLLGKDAEKAIDDALKTRIIPGTQDVLSAESLVSDLIPRLEAKYAEILKADEEAAAKAKAQEEADAKVKEEVEEKEEVQEETVTEEVSEEKGEGKEEAKSKTKTKKK